MDYLSRQKELDELKIIFSKSVQMSLNKDDDATMKKVLFNYYCGKIYDESTKLYKSFEREDQFEEDLFIEQGKCAPPTPYEKCYKACILIVDLFDSFQY